MVFPTDRVETVAPAAIDWDARLEAVVTGRTAAGTDETRDDGLT